MVTELLRVADLRLSRGERAVLRGVSLSVAPGEFCALMGLSGSGKTTVLRAAVALEGFQSGSIDVGGFGLEPGPELRALEQRILQHDPALAAPAAPIVERARRRRGLVVAIAGAALLLAAAIAAAVVRDDLMPRGSQCTLHLVEAAATIHRAVDKHDQWWRHICTLSRTVDFGGSQL